MGTLTCGQHVLCQDLQEAAARAPAGDQYSARTRLYRNRIRLLHGRNIAKYPRLRRLRQVDHAHQVGRSQRDVQPSTSHVVGQPVRVVGGFDSRKLRDLWIDVLDKDRAAVGIGECHQISGQHDRVGQPGPYRAVRNQSAGGSVVDPPSVSSHVGDGGVLADGGNASRLHRAGRGQRR